MVSKNFTEQELACSCCGKLKMHPDMIELLQAIRDKYAKPMFISSAYRCRNHPVEVAKETTGEHTFGTAVDIICHGSAAIDLLKIALDLGVTRIGLNQKGRANGRFIHIGIGDKFSLKFPHKTLWTY